MIDLTQWPDFMTALRDAVLKVTKEVCTTQERRMPPEHDWLTTQEAATFLRKSVAGFRAWKAIERNKQRLVVSYELGDTEPRYQLAALQRLMREGAVGPLDEDLPGIGPVALAAAANGKRRAVGLGAHSQR